VLDQSRIKDLRTNVEVGNTQAVSTATSTPSSPPASSKASGQSASTRTRSTIDYPNTARAGHAERTAGRESSSRNDAPSCKALRAAGNAYPNDFIRDGTRRRPEREVRGQDATQKLDMNPVQVRIAGRIMLRR
jgi:hypothetical protein